MKIDLSMPSAGMPLTPPSTVGSLEPADDSEAAKLDAAAHDFESLMVNELLKSMRRTVPEEENGSFGRGTFTSMLDEQLAQSIAKTGGFGLADALAKDLQVGPQVQKKSVDGPMKPGGSL